MNTKVKRQIFALSGILLLISIVSTGYSNYEDEINKLSVQMADKIASTGKKKIAVVDFTDLEGQVTLLGRFLAEEFSAALASSGKGFSVIDRTRIKTLLKEHKLAEKGFIDPKSAKELGRIAGVEALVTGVITSFGESVRLSIKILDTETAEVIESKRGNIPKTSAITELLTKNIAIGSRSVNIVQDNLKRKTGVTIGVGEEQDFVFELLECKISGQKVTCSLLVTNKGQERVLRLGYGSNPGSKIFDNYGNQYPLSEIQLANKTDRRDVKILLISGIPTKSSLSFEGVSSQATMIALLEIEANSSDKDFFVKLRNIPITRK